MFLNVICYLNFILLYLKKDFGTFEEKHSMREKSIKLVIIIYSLSLFIIIGISVAINHIDNHYNITYSILGMLVAIVPAIYSLIPLIKDALLLLNKRKNRLTSDVFTDRKKDLNHLLTILCSQDHRVEIKGTEGKCGKTWLAMRLCDYINNPKENILETSTKEIPYKRAFYFDLQRNGMENVEQFFDTNIIRATDVIIFDHVTNIDRLIDKQNLYHFQMVYVMKKPTDINFSSHYISKFDINDVATLHDKLRNTYPNLDELSKKEFDILYELTNGNIGRISGVLSEQRSIKWLKKIALGAKTEYDLELDKIQIELFVGHYEIANSMLKKFNLEYSNAMNGLMDIKYKYLLMLSDCKHLLNNYNEALDILSVIEGADYDSYNRDYEIELHKAHYCKHLWHCDEALRILNGLKQVSYTALVDSLGILAAKYFINDLHVDFTDKSSIEVYKDNYICAYNSKLMHNQVDIYKLMRHKAIYKYYANSNSKKEDLISDINEIITIYQAENNRLLANAYFILGEIYRLYGDYDNAIILYKKCLGITFDNNIIIQVNLMVYYLKNIKKLNINFDIIDSQQINVLCQNNNYAEKLYHRIRCIELNDPCAPEITACFESRIMPIL